MKIKKSDITLISLMAVGIFLLLLAIRVGVCYLVGWITSLILGYFDYNISVHVCAGGAFVLSWLLWKRAK